MPRRRAGLQIAGNELAEHGYFLPDRWAVQSGGSIKWHDRSPFVARVEGARKYEPPELLILCAIKVTIGLSKYCTRRRRTRMSLSSGDASQSAILRRTSGGSNAAASSASSGVVCIGILLHCGLGSRWRFIGRGKRQLELRGLRHPAIVPGCRLGELGQAFGQRSLADGRCWNVAVSRRSSTPMVGSVLGLAFERSQRRRQPLGERLHRADARRGPRGGKRHHDVGRLRVGLWAPVGSAVAGRCCCLPARVHGVVLVEILVGRELGLRVAA